MTALDTALATIASTARTSFRSAERIERKYLVERFRADPFGAAIRLVRCFRDCWRVDWQIEWRDMTPDEVLADALRRAGPALESERNRKGKYSYSFGRIANIQNWQRICRIVQRLNRDSKMRKAA